MNDFSSKFSDYNIQIHGVKMPKFELDKETQSLYKIPSGLDSNQILDFLTLKGFEQREKEGQVPAEIKEEAKDRIKYELDIVKEADLSDYFLIIWDLINIARREDIPYGEGRGSCGGSYVLYCLGVTNECPIQNGLFFERFMSKSRLKFTEVDGQKYFDGKLLMDVDLDFSDEKREILIDILYKKYVNRICKLITFGTLQGKKAVKEISKVMFGFTEQEAQKVSDMIPKIFGNVMEPSKAYEEVPDFREFCDKHPNFLKVCNKLSGLVTQKGSHASAYLISGEPMDDLPVETSSSEKEIVSSYDMNFAQLQYIKLDLLGLSSLRIIDEVCKSAGINRYDIKLTYDNTYKHLQYLKTPYELFQISGDAVVKALNKMQPKNLTELSNVISIARPGSMNFIDDYVENVKPTENEKILEILKETNGICIYQESLIRIGKEVFGLTAEEAELVRRVVGKKDTKEMPKWIEKIKENAQKLNLKQEDIDFYIKILNDSANYGFNKSHGYLYAKMAALTVYLKFNYPQHFFVSILNSAKDVESLSAIERELPEFGIKLLAPDVTKSKINFSVEGKDIRFGISEIKGISSKTIEKLQTFIDSEKSNKFQTFAAAKEAGLPIGPLCALIQSGAILSEYGDRPLLVFEAQVFNVLSDKEKSYLLKNGSKYQYSITTALRDYENWTDSNGKKFTKPSRLVTIRKKSEWFWEIWKKNSKYPTLAAYYYEKTLLGYSYSTTLKGIFGHDKPFLVNSKEVESLSPNDAFEFVGEFKELKQGNSKASGKPYIQFVFSDETGELRTMLIGYNYDNFLQKGKKEFPNEEEIVYLRAKRGSSDLHWLIDFETQRKKIYTSLSELKKDLKDSPSLIE